uniref:Uncharacterized protein n=1 Tax=Arundo donax TaxID=35708 RepID=A0A0A8ZWI8_ARUDO
MSNLTSPFSNRKTLIFNYAHYKLAETMFHSSRHELINVARFVQIQLRISISYVRPIEGKLYRIHYHKV